jgi:excisionase family DNA binding protein
MAEQLSIPEAARRLGVSQDTIRRRIRRGELPAHQQLTAQGYRWLVELPVDLLPGPLATEGETASLREEVQQLCEMVLILREELDARRREVQQLLALLQQAHGRSATVSLSEPSLPTAQRRGGSVEQAGGSGSWQGAAVTINRRLEGMPTGMPGQIRAEAISPDMDLDLTSTPTVTVPFRVTNYDRAPHQVAIRLVIRCASGRLIVGDSTYYGTQGGVVVVGAGETVEQDFPFWPAPEPEERSADRSGRVTSHQVLVDSDIMTDVIGEATAIIASVTYADIPG